MQVTCFTLLALCRRDEAAAEQSPDTRAVGRAIFDGTGPPGHTPFRSSRFMPAADEMDNSQVSLLVISLPKGMRLHGTSPSIGYKNSLL